MSEILDCAIIGGGPAGLTAGLYATRGGLENVTMFEKGMPGGQITNSSEIENYPGVTGEITGMDLMNPWPEQCQRFGLKHAMVNVIRVTKSDNIFTIHKEDGTTSDAHSVIIGTGSSPRRAGFSGEDELFGRGVSTCATCDGFFYRNQKVAVIGGGNTAVEEALYLSNIADEVILVHRRDELRSEKILRDQIMEKAKNGNITLMWDNVLEEVLGDNAGVTGMRIKNVKTDETQDIDLHGIFIAIGHKPNTGIFDGQLDMNGGYITVESGTTGNATQTSVEGVFAAGDVMDHVYRQAITSAGTGCMAALDAEKFLDKLAAK